MDKVYNKLVRDNIPEIIRRKGEEPVCHVLSEDEYWDALLKKDEEELIEVKEADSIEERKKELADKLELIRAMAEFNGFTLDDIIKEAETKASKNGAFQKRLFLERVVPKK